MEFFAHLPFRVDALLLQERVTLQALPACCELIDRLLVDEGEEGEIYCIWGCFRVRRERIRGGVRFTLPTCPNALAWSVTSDGEGEVTVHCTINRRDHDAEFVASIEAFVAAWREGLAGGSLLRAPA